MSSLSSDTPPSSPLVHESATDPIRNYFRRLKQILMAPAVFFQRQDYNGSVVPALAFALITQWLGSLLSFLNNSLWGQSFLDRFEKLGGDSTFNPNWGPWAEEARVKISTIFFHWFQSVSSVILSPFLSLITLSISSFFIFLGARLLINSGKNANWNEVNYKTIFIISCFSTAPALFSVVPFIGNAIVFGFTVYLLTVAIREVFQVPNPRAFIIAVFPKLLVIVPLMIFGFALLALLLFGISFLGISLNQ